MKKTLTVNLGGTVYHIDVTEDYFVHKRGITGEPLRIIQL